jgi:hypothetical protein
MLREFLQRIFSPPYAVEDKRIQEQDFVRLKKHIKSDQDNSDEQICNVEHGPLSQHHWQHIPLKRSVSHQASKSAYERYLQQNAAKADNWRAFDELLHPVIEPEDSPTRKVKFLSEEEETDLARVAKATAQFQTLQMDHEERSKRAIAVTAPLVQKVELMVLENTKSVLLTDTKHWQFGTAASAKGTKHKRILPAPLIFKCGVSWLRKQAADSTANEATLRQLSHSMLVPVRAAVAANDRIPLDCIWVLAEDSDVKVRRQIARNPSSSIELLEMLSRDRDERVSAEAKKVLKTIIG